jgi:ribonuclease P protein subunit RPR2
MKERSRTPQTKKIARERIAILFMLARAAFSSHPERSNRYVELARRIAMRQRIRIDREFRREFCRHCSSFLVPGRTSRVRVRGRHVVVTCLCCKQRRRYPLGRDRTDGS